MDAGLQPAPAPFIAGLQDTGGLRRDVDFFIADQNQPGEHVDVEELYPNLGLKMLPYGLNRVDVEVPTSSRLEPTSTGVKMMLDTLHRSRLQIPGMGMGYFPSSSDFTGGGESIIHLSASGAYSTSELSISSNVIS